jgi:hypothetical protein
MQSTNAILQITAGSTLALVNVDAADVILTAGGGSAAGLSAYITIEKLSQ